MFSCEFECEWLEHSVNSEKLEMPLKRNGDIFIETYCMPFQASRKNWDNNSWKVKIYCWNVHVNVDALQSTTLANFECEKTKRNILALIRDT